MKVYQPMSGLHRPVVVDPRLPNFADTRLDVRCVPIDHLNGSRQEASALCAKVRPLFETQGARVTTRVAAGRPDEDPEEPLAEGEVGPPPVELVVELRSRRVHQSKYPLSWAACIATLTALPGVTESTFAVDVLVRDGSGFLLLSDSLEGRIVRRFGAGTWIGNKLFDLWRAEDEKISGDAGARELSEDLYRQLSQMVFNARMHAIVLQQAPLSRRTGAE